MSCCGGDSTVGDDSRALQSEREARIKQGQASIDSAFTGFTPEFYTQRAKAYQAAQMPVLSQAYRDTQGQLGARLANSHLINSSAGNAARLSLLNQMNQAKQTVADQGLAQSQRLQQDVEAQRTALYNQLQATADPSLASSRALAAATQYTAPSPIAPVSNLLSDWASNYLYRRLANQGGAGAVMTPNYNTTSTAYMPKADSYQG